MPQKISPSHGDLTLENVFVNEQTHSIKMIDPDGSDFYDDASINLTGRAGQIIKVIFYDDDNIGRAIWL